MILRIMRKIAVMTGRTKRMTRMSRLLMLSHNLIDPFYKGAEFQLVFVFSYLIRSVCFSVSTFALI